MLSFQKPKNGGSSGQWETNLGRRHQWSTCWNFVCVCPVKMQKGRREGRREVGMTTVSRCERGAKEVRGCNPRRCHATQTDTFEWVERYLSVFYALLLLLLLFLVLCVIGIGEGPILRTFWDLRCPRLVGRVEDTNNFCRFERIGPVLLTEDLSDFDDSLMRTLQNL